eukprot:12077557-Prorocentrum_lima.AAC.1
MSLPSRSVTPMHLAICIVSISSSMVFSRPCQVKKTRSLASAGREVERGGSANTQFAQNVLWLVES